MPALAAAVSSGRRFDGWIGTHELPGYRAGCVVARLCDVPPLARDHLYFDLLLLDAAGQAADHSSGPCAALPRVRPVDERSRHVRLAAELVRHVADDGAGLAVAGPALAYIREYGVGTPCMRVAAQLLDDTCSAAAVARSLHQLLLLTLGDEEAEASLRELAARLDTGLDAVPGPPAGPLLERVAGIVRCVGRQRARACLRDFIGSPLVPTADMFGV